MIPDSAIEGEALLRLVMFGHLHFQSLWAGIELGVFELLESEGPSSLERLATDTRLELQPMRMVIANLAALGLLESRESVWANSPVARQFLLERSPRTVVAVIRWQARIVYPGVERYVQSLRDNRNVGIERFPGVGRTLYERLADDPELERVFQDAMASMPSNRFLAETLPLTGRHTLCDCGGGNGRNAIQLALRHPTLQITIFDRPTVCAKARENIAAKGLADRISTHEGNFLEDPFPSVDSILYSHIGPIWSRETNVKVFRRAREALPSGGAFFIYNMVADDDQTGPISVTCGSVYFHALATGEGFMYSALEYEAMLREAGFRAVESVRNLPVSHALVIGTK